MIFNFTSLESKLSLSNSVRPTRLFRGYFHVQILAVLFTFSIILGAQAQTPTKLASGGKAVMPIVVSTTASERGKASAAVLAEYLSRISGAKFEVRTLESNSAELKDGIVVGRGLDFPNLALAKPLISTDATRREDYLLRSFGQGALVLGVTDIAVENAVWDFLYRLGYRQFFPGAHWEVVPRQPELSIVVDAQEHPDYYSRRIWFTYGTWPEQGKAHAQWSARNRAVFGIALNTGHAYGHIIADEKQEFDAHPEYFALIDGKRQPNKEGKFCISNPGLRKVVTQYAVKYFEKYPTADSVSLDPSDGGNWCQCEACAKMGSVSDRVTLLANEVVEGVNKQLDEKLGTKYVGFYAYNMHSPPPKVKVDPRIIVSVATAFIQGGYTVDQLMEGWKRQGAILGMREYYSIIHWDHDMPMIARGARPEYMIQTIPNFYKAGARYMSAESSDNWGPNGLGYYIAARLLWDIDEAGKVDALVNDFIERAFGTAKAPMREVYNLLNGIDHTPKMPFSDDYLGRLYRALDAAFKATTDQGAQARIGDVALYVRFAEMFQNYRAASGPQRQQLFEEMIRYSYRVRGSSMIHSMALYRTKVRDKAMVVPAEATWQIAEKDKAGKPLNPWKQSTPHSLDEIREIVRGGIERNKLFDFKPVTFSGNLVPATPLKLPAVKPGQWSRMRGSQEYFTWLPAGANKVSAQVTSGLVYSNRGNTKVALYNVDSKTVDPAVPLTDGENAADENDEAMPTAVQAQTEVPSDAAPHEVVLKTDRTGLHRVVVNDRRNGTTIELGDLPMTIESSLRSAPVLQSRWSLYFYVPKGTQRVGAFASGEGQVFDPAGKVVYDFTGKPTYFSVAVGAGQDGKLWRFAAANGRLALMTVPPYMSSSEKSLLLPAEVVAADSRN